MNRTLTLAALSAALLAPSAAHAAPAAQPVKLSDARTAPDYLRALKPGRTVTVTRQCRFSDTSAYRGRGGRAGRAALER